MFFTVEPMINLGRPHVKVLSDGWTAVTRDRSLSAQFEHTIGVTADGCEIFTLSPAGLRLPALAHLSEQAQRKIMGFKDAQGFTLPRASASTDAPMPGRHRLHKARARRPTITATATGCANASWTAAPMPCPTTNCSNWFCSAQSPAPTPSRIAKALLARFGSFRRRARQPRRTG